MVESQGPLLGGALGGADVHKTVDLPTIGVDNFAVQGLSQMQGQAALAHRRRPNDGNKRSQIDGHVGISPKTRP